MFEFVTEGRRDGKPGSRPWLFTAVHRYGIAPEPGGCRVTYTQELTRLSGAPKPLFARGVNRLVFRVSAKYMRRGFDGLLALAEEQSGGLSTRRTMQPGDRCRDRFEERRRRGTMGTGARLNKEAAPQVESMPGFEGRYAREDGYVLGFESFDQAGDFTPMYRGLPDDRCQSHHWGYVITGRMIMHRPEGDIVAEEGEAYYVGPGHTGEAGLPGTHVIEFSPAAEYDETMAVVSRNLEAAAGGE